MNKRQTVCMIAAVAGTPVLKAVLEQAGSLKLVPLVHWGWDETTISAITYVVATAGAALGWIWTVRSRRSRTWLLAGGILALTIGFLGYSWVTRTPPTVQTEVVFDLIGYSTFFLTQVAFGFLVARVAKEFAK